MNTENIWINTKWEFSLQRKQFHNSTIRNQSHNLIIRKKFHNSIIMKPSRSIGFDHWLRIWILNYIIIQFSYTVHRFLFITSFFKSVLYCLLFFQYNFEENNYFKCAIINNNKRVFSFFKDCMYFSCNVFITLNTFNF